MNVFEQKNADFVTECDRYVREHPEFADQIPDGALVAMLLEGDGEFDRWSRDAAREQAEHSQPTTQKTVAGTGGGGDERTRGLARGARA